MNEDFIPFELAVKLKEKGYPQRTFGEYDMQGACYIEDGRFYENGCITEVARAYTAPTISQVLKWLREEKKIHVVCPFYKDKGFYYYVQRLGNAARIVSSFGDSDDCFATYEQAAIAGIEYVLEYLN